jgi:hypothetical protein
MADSDIKFNFDKRQLQNIAKFFEKKHSVKIGILSKEWKENPDKKWERKIGPVELGAVHEFGSQKRNIPQRSFLRKTMMTRKDDFKAEIYYNRDKMVRGIAKGNFSQFLEKVGITWRDYVLDTFDRQGPGWRALKKRTIRARRKEFNPATGKKEASHKILWVSGALARSVDYEVVE